MYFSACAQLLYRKWKRMCHHACVWTPINNEQCFLSRIVILQGWRKRLAWIVWGSVQYSPGFSREWRRRLAWTFWDGVQYLLGVGNADLERELINEQVRHRTPPGAIDTAWLERAILMKWWTTSGNVGETTLVGRLGSLATSLACKEGRSRDTISIFLPNDLKGYRRKRQVLRKS